MTLFHYFLSVFIIILSNSCVCPKYAPDYIYVFLVKAYLCLLRYILNQANTEISKQAFYYLFRQSEIEKYIPQFSYPGFFPSLCLCLLSYICVSLSLTPISLILSLSVSFSLCLCLSLSLSLYVSFSLCLSLSLSFSLSFLLLYKFFLYLPYIPKIGLKSQWWSIMFL